MTASTVREDRTARKSTETKAAFKTTEFLAYVAAVAAVIVVSTLIKHSDGHNDYFRADKAMFYIVLLTIAYLGSRGLAKSGSRDFYDADRNTGRGTDRGLDRSFDRGYDHSTQA